MKLPRDPKSKLLASDSTVIHDGRITEGSPGDRNRNPADPIIDDFASAQNGDGIGTVVSVDRHADNSVFPF